MDGGFFSLEAMTGGPVLQTVSPASTTEPKFNFKRTAKARELAEIAAENAPPGLTTAQITKLTDSAFEAHHLFPMDVLDADEGSPDWGFPRQLRHMAPRAGFREALAFPDALATWACSATPAGTKSPTDSAPAA
ncbi:MAG: hypothetical protein ACK446_07270 [Rhodobacterales bacterium]|jgi:hypothetical protein